MSSTRTLWLAGAGNPDGVRLALAIARTEPRWDRCAIVDDDPRKIGKMLLGVEVVGPLSLLADADPRTSEVANLVARTTRGRAAVKARLDASGIPAATLVHPGVETIGAAHGRDAIVYEYAVLGADSTLGEGSVVFPHAVVGHESRVGRCCVVAAGAVLNARVELDDEVYVGTNASILPEVRVGRGATIGANTAVIADVPAGATVVGVPGQVVDVRPAVSVAEVVDDDRVVAAEESTIADSVAALFCARLGIDTLGTNDNFFALGGSSLLALRVAIELRASSGFDVGPIDVFRFPTARSLARHLAQRPSPERDRVRATTADLRRRLHAAR